MNQQVKNLIFALLILLIHRADCNQNEIYSHPFFPNNYLDYEKGLIYKSLKQLQDSVTLVNNGLFSNPFNKNLYTTLYANLQQHSPNSILVNKKVDKPKFKRTGRLQFIQQMNKEIIKNQLVAYEKFFNKLKRYDSDPMESRQSVVNLLRTLFRFPVLLLFSNIFQLPLLPTLILASPFLNSQESPNSISNSLASTISKTPLSAAVTNAVQNTVSGALAPSSATPLQTASSQQIASHLPFSLNPLVPINQLLNNFINEVIGDLQNAPIFNSLIQGVNQALAKPNRLGIQMQNQPLPSSSQQLSPNQPLPTNQLLNQNLTKPISSLNATDADLISNASTVSFAYQEPPRLVEPLPNKPLIGPVLDENGNVPGGNSILNTLASSLLESNKNYQLTGK